MVSTLRDADDAPIPLDPAPMPMMPNPLMTHTSEDMARLCETHGDMGPDQLEDEADTGNENELLERRERIVSVCAH